ncbi:hypothetical protein TNCV_1387991 [Trichonephila clavipes]|nr:hypothetical protein TNCV_1387991 [Trichonephila clavipes]
MGLRTVLQSRRPKENAYSTPIPEYMCSSYKIMRREKKERGDGKREEKGSGRERGARLVWRKGLSPEIGVERR